MARHNAMLLIFAAGAAALLGAACSSETGPGTRTPPAQERSRGQDRSPAPAPRGSHSEGGLSCPNATEIAGDSEAPTGGVVRGDVTGDGTPDEVWLALDPSAPRGCRALVVARSDEAIDLLSLGPRTIAPSPNPPAISSLAAVDDRAGLDVVVDIAAGASTSFAGVFSFGGGSPARLAGPGGSSSVTRDLFAYGGSVGHLEGVDCAGEAGSGRIVVSTAVPRGDRYLVTRRFFQTEDSKLRPLAELRQRLVVSPRRVGKMPGLVPSPFPSCRA